MKRSKAMFLRVIPSLFPFFLLILILASCAHPLPKIDDMILHASEKRMYPEIVGTRGHLPPDRAKKIFQRLEKEAYWTDILQRQAFLAECISGSSLTAGNKATLLVDGNATYAAMREAIRNAKDHINFETYSIDADEIGHEMADLLLAKRAEGVEVHLIYDSIGCFNTPTSFFQRLRDGGVKTLEFHPLNPLAQTSKDWSLIERDHRKILIVDGSLAITGGVNIGRSFSQSIQGEYSEDVLKRPWRDTDVQIEGPAVADFQRLFLDTWEKKNGSALNNKERFFPPPRKAGNQLVHVVGSTARENTPVIYLLYLGAIRFSATSIHLTNAYFVPSEDMVEALTDAAKRGVDVKLILPGTTDHSMVLSAGRSHYTRLLKSGVKIFERQDRLLHAKTAVIDGVWSTVGSSNMDLWSFRRNDEVNAIILGKDFATHMEEMFANDLKEAKEIDLEQWEKRSLKDRIAEWFGRLFSHWL